MGVRSTSLGVQGQLMGSGLYLLVCEGQVRNCWCVRATGGGQVHISWCVRATDGVRSVFVSM